MLKQIFFLALFFSFFAVECYSQLDKPESVVYYSNADAYLISNVGSGKIIKMGADRKFEDFVTGLTGPKGLVINKTSLWVADVTKVVEIDIIKKKVINTYDMPNSKFLNDTEFDKDGNLYVSDTEMNCIYKLSTATKKIEIMKPDGIIEPNGLLYDYARNRMIVVSYGDNATVKSIDLKSNKVTTLLATKFSDFDGVQFSGNADKLFFSSWGSKAIFICDIDKNGNLGEPKIFRDNLESPADFLFVKKKNVIALPQMMLSKITFIDVQPK